MIDKTPEQLANDRRSAAMNPQSKPQYEDLTTQVIGRADAAAASILGSKSDIRRQIQLCIDDVRDKLQEQGFPESSIRLTTVRTTRFPAARAEASTLGTWLRQVGAREAISFIAVDHLGQHDAAIEVEVWAHFQKWTTGSPPPKDGPREPIPENLRPAIRAELDALVRGERPEQMLCVDEYGEDGATLVTQPEDIWYHASSTANKVEDGGWWVVLPLWTETECPSDLSVQLQLTSSGNVHIELVSVM